MRRCMRTGSRRQLKTANVPDWQSAMDSRLHADKLNLIAGELMNDNFVDQTSQQRFLFVRFQQSLIPDVWKSRADIFEHLQQVCRNRENRSLIHIFVQLLFSRFDPPQTFFPSSFQFAAAGLV